MDKRSRFSWVSVCEIHTILSASFIIQCLTAAIWSLREQHQSVDLPQVFEKRRRWCDLWWGTSNTPTTQTTLALEINLYRIVSKPSRPPTIRNQQKMFFEKGLLSQQQEMRVKWDFVLLISETFPRRIKVILKSVSQSQWVSDSDSAAQGGLQKDPLDGFPDSSRSSHDSVTAL